ncbi:MAG: hypothetical protein PHQ24_10500 [Proteiniphilum sp.]|nr:hypothetical protein [Proteiniphilum sp.]
MIMNFRALAGQTPLRIIAKATVSLLFVGLAAVVSREDLALAIMIIFMGVTGPTIRLVTMKMDGVYNRIIVSPASKYRFFFGFAGHWIIAVLLPLIPAIAVVMILKSPVTIVFIILGTVLAVALGTLAGVMSRGLSEAHLAALLTSGLLISLSLIRTPVAGFISYTAFSASSFEPAALITAVILPAVAIVVLALVVSRS